MKRTRRLLRMRTAGLCLAGGLLAMLAGDRGAQMAPPPGVGIDPFEVLDQQVKNNVLIVLDTSGSMKWPSDRDDVTLGADDPASRMFQAKQAIKAVVAANANRVNFGLATYNVLNSQKTINQGQDFEGDGRPDGPFMYVSADTAAQNFYTNHLCPDGVTRDGFFCQIDATFANYDGTNSADVWRSFSNRGGNNQANAINNPYPTGCTPGTGNLSPVDLTNPAAMRCRFYIQSRLIRNGFRYTWNRAQNAIANRLVGLPQAITCPAPPPGLVGYTSPTPTCFQFQDGTNGPIATYYYTSAIYERDTGSACGGGALITEVAECTSNNAPVVLANMDPELPVLPGVFPPPPSGTFTYGNGHLDGDQTPSFGLRADQSTPLAGTLNFIRTTATPAFPPQIIPGQRNFVILVTDGDDTCADSNLDRASVLAAEAAEQLYNNFNPVTNTGNFQHWAETLVVGFASAVSPARVNVIAQGGSGRQINGGAATPAAALGICNPGQACRDAFFASNTQQLVAILNQALERAASTGFFSATPSVFDAVPEYVQTIVPTPSPPISVTDPDRRYQGQAFISYRASFEAGSFKGFVNAFNDQGPISGWEAGQKLMDRMSPDIQPGAGGVDHSFRDLLGPFGPGTPPTAPTGIANHINRRIFTTRRNGNDLWTMDAVQGPIPNTTCGGSCQVNLWPPDTVVAPNDWTTAGVLDERLFRKPDGTAMTLAELKSPPLRACQGSNLHFNCTTSATAAQQLAAAKREAREMILAYTAGAEPRRDGLGNPVRFATGAQVNMIVYRRRSWALSESTVGAPAIVTAPVNLTPAVHTQEYLLFRDGPRDNAGQAPGNVDTFIRMGFGLRHPDRDGDEQPAGPLTRPLLKPVMSVLYVPANDMLHAFRAGPCPGSTGYACVGENGGEELWAFVPHDLLPELKHKMKPQTRTDHTFMISTSLRFADVFVPGSFSFTFNGRTHSGTGRWRRIMLFGRGIGGKYYTAMDITAPGSMGNAALQTKLPTVLWNRGNPDTEDGLPGGTRVRNVDFNDYLDMGQTWSTPAVTRVNPTNFGGKEYVAFTGSGYGSAPDEGTRFYALDVMTGNILATTDMGDGTQTLFQNALVANPVVYTDELLVGGVELPHPSAPQADAAYIGDIHGRLWKIDFTDPNNRQLFRELGPDQPIGAAAALLNLGKPHVFVTTGHEARVAPPSDGFKVFGFEDDGFPYPPGIVTPPLSPPEISIDLPPSGAPGKGPYRGTLQPVTAFRGPTVGGEGIVFFTATRFNPVSLFNCVSSFDTLILGLVANTGGTAYATQEYEGVKAVGVPRPPVPPVTGDPAPVDQGTAPPNQKPEARVPPAARVGQAAIVRTETVRQGSPVCSR